MNDRELRLEYEHNNRRFFDGTLPAIEIGFSPISRKKHGRTLYRLEKGRFEPYKVILASDLRSWTRATEVGMVLLHEMCHVKLGYRPSCKVWNGPFDQEMQRLASAGAFSRYW